MAATAAPVREDDEPGRWSGGHGEVALHRGAVPLGDPNELLRPHPSHRSFFATSCGYPVTAM